MHSSQSGFQLALSSLKLTSKLPSTEYGVKVFAKLAVENIPGSWLRWLRWWLADPRACILWKDTLSRARCMSAGMPQGSPLSPLLFDLFVADLPAAICTTSPSMDIIQYVDDITFAAEKMQVALDSLTRWSGVNAIEIIAKKTLWW